MKFTTETEALREALKKLGFAINAKSVLPAISNILATVADKEVTLTTTDLLVTISYRIPCEPEESNTSANQGSFLMPYEQLKNIVALEGGPVTITWDAKKGAIAQFQHDTFSLGNSNTVDDFPKPQKAGRMPYTAPAELSEALRIAAMSVSKEESRPAMQNICVELSKDAITVTSTDAQSLYTQNIPAQLDLEEQVELLIPPVVAKVLEGFTDCKIGFNKNFMSFEAGPITVTTKRAEGKFPAWRIIMPEHNPNVVLQLEDLKQAVAKAYVVSDSTYNGIDFILTQNELELKTEVEDTGIGCSIRVAATSSSPVHHIRYNGRLVKRMIAQMEAHAQQDTLNWSIMNANKQATVKISGNPNITCLVMPILINQNK